MAKSTKRSVGRRGFLKGAAVGAAALAAKPQLAPAQQSSQQPAGRGAQAPSGAAVARETGAARPAANARVIENPGSDFMVDVFKTLNLEYLSANPGSTFESLHESLINYGDNKMPEFLTCTHEENAVAMAHGYAKIEGKPMMALIHGDIGLQHAGMAIYNAYCDRVPIYIVVGNHSDGAERNPGVQSYHSAQDLGALVRDYTKWDDQPYSLGAFAESAVRAYKIAMTPPMGPVLIVAGAEIQSHAMEGQRPRIPKLVMTTPPAGDMGAVAEAARMLVAAERPMIIPERYARTPEGIKLLIELAETLQSPVNNRERMNFPNRHPLAGNGGAGYQPDVTLALEVQDILTEARAARPRNAKVIQISSVSLSHKSNIQDFGHYADIDLDIGADAEATLPYLIEACKKLITADRQRALKDRGAKLAEAHRKNREADVEALSWGWNASPVSVGRIAAELWPLLKNEDWSFVSPQGFVGNWPNRIWNMEKHYHYIGGQGAGGMGYGAPASVGAALANRKYGRLSINIQTDGDFNYSPGVFWTAAHHRIPLLSIMHNNRGYHQEVMFVEQMASAHNRGAERAGIGTKLWDPDINYASIAKGYGLYAEGPITDPKDLAPALKRGVERVKKGEPVLIDVVTQPRG
ncbi:MAG: twin-arginine translocation signal domain-containing protein [Acidobacteriia bacterium]|nr:twin-arginine translocation signal domain-containing protein [Terriglobia bacterium]